MKGFIEEYGEFIIVVLFSLPFAIGIFVLLRYVLSVL